MSTVPPDDAGQSGSDSASGPGAEVPFDPYRFGKPDVPPPPEYAPPGYVPDPPTTPSAASPGPGQPYPPYGQAPYGQPPYGQAPYGQAPPGAPYPGSPYGPPPYGAYPRNHEGSSGKAVTALVLGICSIVFFWTTFLDAVVVVLAIIFGFLGMAEAKRRGGSGRGLALAGLICAVIGAVAIVAMLVLIVHLANRCGGIDHQDSPGFQRCLRRHL